MQINRTKEINIQSLISKIRENFGDDNIFLTFVLSRKGVQRGTEISTFGSDNIDFLDNWIHLMKAKFHSGNIKSISFVLRRFLRGDNNKVEISNPQGKKIKIPKKEIYHFFASKDFIVFFNQKDTFEMQNTNHSTGKLLPLEESINCMSSEILFDELFNKNFNLDNILEKISNIGEENLTKYEKEFLKSVSK